jgi:malate/lactate dehydrogenase
MKPLEIAIISENLRAARAIKMAIIMPNKTLGDLRKRCSIYNDPAAYQTILRENPDLIILGSNSTQDPTGSTGLKTVCEIKKTDPNLPIILSSDPQTIVRAMRTNKVDAYILDPNNPEQVREVVRKKARKPLNIAIIGLGQLGIGFMQRLAKSPNAKTVRAYSRSMLDQYENIRKLEGIKDNTRISLENTLEGALSNTDCALICTSARHGTSADKIAESFDRSDLFKDEYKKNEILSKAIAKLKYPGLLLYFTNPIGEILEQSRRTGLESGQLTSPFILDEARIITQLKNNLSPQDYNKLIREISIVGQHGNPCVNFSSNLPDETKRTIEDAIRDSKTSPGDSMKAHAALGIGYQVQSFYMPVFKHLAHFKARTPHSAYSYCEVNGQKGYIAVPQEVNYFPNIRITPNQEKIDQLNKEIKNNLTLGLKNQALNIQKYLGEAKN